MQDPVNLSGPQRRHGFVGRRARDGDRAIARRSATLTPCGGEHRRGEIAGTIRARPSRVAILPLAYSAPIRCASACVVSVGRGLVWKPDGTAASAVRRPTCQHRQPRNLQAAQMTLDRMRRIGTSHRHRIARGPRPRSASSRCLDRAAPASSSDGRSRAHAASAPYALRRAGSGDKEASRRFTPSRRSLRRHAPSARVRRHGRVLTACAAAPSRVVSNTSLPSGLAIRPRKL